MLPFLLLKIAVNGFEIATLSATDIEDTSLNFSILNGNTDAIFALDSSTGKLTVADRTLLDFERTTSYSLSVQATDSGNASGTATVTVNVTEVAENQQPVADSSFGNTTTAGLSVSNGFSALVTDRFVDAVKDSSGRYLVLGNVDNANADISISRHLADGTLDLSFGLQGRLSKDLGGIEIARAIAVDSNSNIYIGGDILSGTTSQPFIVKLTSNGAADTSFGSNGVSIGALGSSPVAVADILMHSDGALLFAGKTSDQFGVYKLNATTGALTTSTTIDMSGIFDTPVALAEQADKQVIVAGYTADASEFDLDFAVARIAESDLSLDSSFASAGKTTIDLGQSQDDRLRAATVTSSGQILLSGGISQGEGIEDIAVVSVDRQRYLGQRIRQLGHIAGRCGFQPWQWLCHDLAGGYSQQSTVCWCQPDRQQPDQPIRCIKTHHSRRH